MLYLLVICVYKLANCPTALFCENEEMPNICKLKAKLRVDYEATKH
jgi:hypothetical protein